MTLRRSGLIPVSLFFVGLLAVGLRSFPDYGVTSDEEGLRRYGHQLFDYLKTGDRSYEEFSNLRYYGPVVPLLLELVERIGSVRPEWVYPARHLLNYGIFLLGVAAFHVLCSRQFGSWRFGLLGAALLAATPRLFAHAFVNVKDMPFMALFVVNVTLLIAFLETRKLRFMAAQGVATALLIDVRILGILMPLLTLAALMADEWTASKRSIGSNVLLPMAVCVGVCVPLTVLLWPYLWAAPVDRFMETFRIMSRFRMGPRYTRYMGEMVRTKLVPWHFIPVWLAVSTPLAYLALFLLGVADRVMLLKHPLRHFRERAPDRFFLIHAAWLFGPLAWIMVSHAILYDDWRQVMFVYPAFVLFCVAGARFAATRVAAWKRIGEPLFYGVVALAVASVAGTMVRLHPYQLVFFNKLVGGPEGAQYKFELDYWGFSYKEAMQYLLDYQAGPLRVKACLGPGPDNAVLFADRTRFRFVDTKEAEFMMCARWEAIGPYVPGYPIVYRVTRDGAHLLYIRRIRNPDGSPIAQRR